MKKNTFLYTALALSSVFAPLKTQSKGVSPKLEHSNVSTNSACYINPKIENLNVDGIPFLIYGEKEKDSSFQPTQTHNTTVQKDLTALLDDLEPKVN